MKITLQIVLAIILVLGLGFGLTSVAFFSQSFWSPKFQNLDRQVFENTKSFRDGSRRDLDNLYVTYKTAKTQDEKDAILSVIRQRADGVPEDQIPAEIQPLLNQGN